ncbi:MAG: YraN family protein [Bacteroides sp.]|nr:YraN family protein [Bacteroides sp.]
MAIHNELGKEGEREAILYLERKGYRIRHRNWRSGRKELDIVAEHEGELVVIEVRTRRNKRFGHPEESINEQKLRRIIAATDAYVRKFAIDAPVRFDIISILGEESPLKIEHIQDAFYPPIW